MRVKRERDEGEVLRLEQGQVEGKK